MVGTLGGVEQLRPQDGPGNPRHPVDERYAPGAIALAEVLEKAQNLSEDRVDQTQGHCLRVTHLQDDVEGRSHKRPAAHASETDAIAEGEPQDNGEYNQRLLLNALACTGAMLRGCQPARALRSHCLPPLQHASREIREP